MSVCLVNPFIVGAGGGSDVAPSALNWADISGSEVSPSSAIFSNADQTIAGVDAVIVARAAWTSTSSSPARLRWKRNGAAVGGFGTTSRDATIAVGDVVHFDMTPKNAATSGNFDTGTVRVTNESRTATITVTIASPGVVTWTAHGFSASDKVLFRTTGALPTGMATETVYYVLAAGLGADVFEISATDGGAAINTSGSQSGAHTGVSVLDTFAFDVEYVYSGGGGGSPP